MSSTPLNAAPAKAAKRADRALTGRALVPGDKSISHRAFMLAALATGTTQIHGLLEGADVLATGAAMQALGAHIVKQDGVYHVTGVGAGGLKTPDAPLDFGNAGTGVRLGMGLAAGRGVRMSKSRAITRSTLPSTTTSGAS